MTPTRRFCRFSKAPETATFGMPEVPEDGLCLSTFVLLSEAGRPSTVLMGKMDPKADWEQIGALDPARVEAHRHGWVLPSSHLILHESPQEAAVRILREQLGLGPLRLDGPQVVSEVYTPRRFPSHHAHWDLEFLFRGTLEAGTVPSSHAWTELRFVDPATTGAETIARSHEDLLASAGFPVGKPPKGSP